MIRPESLLLSSVLSSVNFNTEVPAQPLIKEHSHGVMVRRIMENIPQKGKQKFSFIVFFPLLIPFCYRTLM